MRILLAWLWPMLRQRWRMLALAVLLALVALAAGVALLGVSGWFITATALVNGALAAFNLFVPSASVRGLAFVRILARYGERVAGHAATLQLLSDLRSRVFGQLLRLDARQLARWRDGDLVARLTGDVDALDSAFLLSIQPLLVGGNADALMLSAALEACGYWVTAIRPPTVPDGSARLRIALSALHEAAQIDGLLEALQRVRDSAVQTPPTQTYLSSV